MPGISAEESITVSTDKPSYNYGENYTISGKISPVIPNEPVSIMVLSSHYPHPESFSFIPNSDGRYSYTLPLPTRDISGGNFTIQVQYAGTKNQTTFIYSGLPCYQRGVPAYGYLAPIERMPASNPRILDSSGNAIRGPVRVGQQIQISYDLANGMNCNLPFVYLVQIQDHNGVTVSLSWITGTLLAGQSLNPSQSWTPQYDDTYTAQIFTWQSLDNPNALLPPVSVAFDVVSDTNSTRPLQTTSELSSKFTSGFLTNDLDYPLKQFNRGIGPPNLTCMRGFQLVLKAEDNAPACVHLSTAKRLVAMKWAQNLDLGPDNLVFAHYFAGSAYPYGGAMGARAPLVNMPQKFNMSHIENNGATEAITLFSHDFALQLDQNNTISYSINATAPITFNLWLENRTSIFDNISPDADKDENVLAKTNVTSYSGTLTGRMVTAVYAFEFTVDNPKPVATVTFDAFRK